MDLQKLAKNAALRLTDDDNGFRGYRNAEEVIANAIRNETKLLEDELNALRCIVVETIGGTVEGNPTSEHNYLHRLRQLIRIETAARTFVKDWQDGDFTLPGLAEIHSTGIMEALKAP